MYQVIEEVEIQNAYRELQVAEYLLSRAFGNASTSKKITEELLTPKKKKRLTKNQNDLLLILNQELQLLDIKRRQGHNVTKEWLLKLEQLRRNSPQT